MKQELCSRLAAEAEHMEAGYEIQDIVFEQESGKHVAGSLREEASSSPGGDAPHSLGVSGSAPTENEPATGELYPFEMRGTMLQDAISVRLWSSNDAKGMTYSYDSDKRYAHLMSKEKKAKEKKVSTFVSHSWSDRGADKVNILGQHLFLQVDHDNQRALSPCCRVCGERTLSFVSFESALSWI